MRTAIAACSACVLVGLAAGWLFRSQPVEPAHYIVQKPPVTQPAAPKPLDTRFPDYPKPTLEAPKPIMDASTPPSSLVGELPTLPNASLPNTKGVIGPLVPEASTKLPTTDLNADEALAKRIVLQLHGEVVSSADAKDATGKVGRTIVAETDPDLMKPLQTSLQEALRDRVVLSDAGSVGGTSPELTKAQDGLEISRKALEKARIDFLPQDPILRQMEDDYAQQQQAVAEIRKRTGRRRLNVMIRPGVAVP